MTAKANTWVLQAGEPVLTREKALIGRVGAVTRGRILIDLADGGSFWIPQDAIAHYGQDGVSLGISTSEIHALRQTSGAPVTIAPDQDLLDQSEVMESRFQA